MRIEIAAEIAVIGIGMRVELHEAQRPAPPNGVARALVVASAVEETQGLGQAPGPGALVVGALAVGAPHQIGPGHEALVGQLLRIGVAVVAGSRLWEHSCSRLGTARRCEPPPAPRVPTLCGRGAQHPTPAGVPGAARKNTCLWRTGGQPGWCGTQEEQLRKPSEDTSSLEKTSGTAAVRTGAAGQRVQPL